MPKDVREIVRLIKGAKTAARGETKGRIEPAFARKVEWPVSCTVGPGLEGAIACESKVGYVNGTQGVLLYRGYDIFDLCAHCSFEEVCYLLVHGRLPAQEELAAFSATLSRYRPVRETLRELMGFPIEHMQPMAALRLGANLMRWRLTEEEKEAFAGKIIGTDEDSIPMETMPTGEKKAVYEFEREGRRQAQGPNSADLEAAYHLIAGLPTIAAAISRVRRGQMPLEPDPQLGHAANYLYMLRGVPPSPVEEKIMDIALILHADHGMNASMFAALVVASTLSDLYASAGAGIAALTGPLHGGANEQVIEMLREIGSPQNVECWFERARNRRQRIMGFGHRVYKVYDPRARVLGTIARFLAERDHDIRPLFDTATALEQKVISALGATKKVFPNVDFFSGLVYTALGIPEDMFAATFAVARVAGWMARILEYLENNRLFRPRAIYTGPLRMKFIPLKKRNNRPTAGNAAS